MSEGGKLPERAGAQGGLHPDLPLPARSLLQSVQEALEER